ncbi:MAG TPA: hypothetical protein P5067_04985 [Candidatus Marinimicrobia bacterium]|nr:hypothetical protein [Candidatus Neomarinimicrobiota bacterium]HRS51763.1 hypothetical protein [Candidatus Neomarinimicrobiota bacterium]
MGTQQILMIVLSVIIVGVAVGVGITMFQNQARTSNRQAVVADLNNLASQAIAYYKMPKSMGGGGNGTPGFVAPSEEGAVDQLLSYLGFVTEGEGATATTTYTNDNGTYTMTSRTATGLTITGVGKEKVDATNYVGATLTIDMTQAPGSQIKISVDN